MKLSDALTAGGRLLVQRPAGVLPFFLLAVAVLPTARVPLLVALAAALWSLRAEGRIEPAVRALSDVDRGALTAGDPDAVPPELADALFGLATPTVVVVLGVGLAASTVVFLLAQAVAGAATASAVLGGLRDADPLPAGVVGVRRHWTAFLGLVLLRAALLALVVGAFLVAAVVLAGDPVAGLLALGLAVLVAVALVAALAALSFAGAAVVADDVGAVGGARRSLGFVRRRPFAAVAYLVVVVGVGAGTAALAGAASLAGAQQAVAVVSALVVAPYVQALTVALYADERPAPRSTPPVGRRTVAAFGCGWRELRRFVVGHPLALLGAFATLIAGVLAGWSFTAPLGTRLDVPPDVTGVFGAFPVGAFLTIAANNWLVAVASAYGGVALGIPSVASLLFNGAVVGAVAGVFEPVPFLALVAPHGVVELPALVVAGALGLHLGRVGFGAVWGRRSAEAVGAELQRAMWVLVGLALVLVLAAFVEAFLTPRVAQAVLDRV